MSVRKDILDVTAAILVHRGHILIAQRPGHDRLAGLWEFPGGKLEAGEKPEEGLARELHEEFGITVRIGCFLGDSIYHYAHGSIRLLAYQVFWTGGEMYPVAHQEIRFVSVSELADFVFSPADIPFVQGILNGSLPIG